MENYPRTLSEFEDRFTTESACRQYLIDLRWPEGFRCPRCSATGAWEMKDGLKRCHGCDHKQSATAGTIFHRSHLPLRVWFRAMWWVTNQKSGVSASGLQRLLGLGSYETAWALLQKLRRAMVRPGREKLSGNIEVDETFVGGVDKGSRGRHLGNKALVAVAAELDGRGIGRIRLGRIPDASARSLHAFVETTAERGSTIITDGWPSYDDLKSQGFKHKPRTISGSQKTASTLLPRVHRVAALLKRWLLGTHQGAISREHLDYYLDEFTFRFNRRSSQHRGKLFYRLVQQAAVVDPVPYSKLVSNPSKR